MKTKKKHSIPNVVKKLSKITKDRGIKQETIAEYAGVDPSQMSKIFYGTVQLSMRQLANIATKLGMREIDIYSYPDIYRKVEGDGKTHKVLVEIEVSDEELGNADLKSKIKIKYNL